MVPHATFVDATARSADDLLTDLEACRQLRHVSPDDRLKIVKVFFGDIQHSLREGKKLPGTGRYFVRTGEAFEEAFALHGFACDICSDVHGVEENKWRTCADRALSNLDGLVKLMLCNTCANRFSTFCHRYFDREVRVPFSRDLEQMMLAFVAFELGATARRIMAGNPPRRRKTHEQDQRNQDGIDRAIVAPRFDCARNLSLDWRTQKHRAEIPEGVRR